MLWDFKGERNKDENIAQRAHVCRFTHHKVFRRAVKLDSVTEQCLLKAGDAQSKRGKDTSYQQILSARAF